MNISKEEARKHYVERIAKAYGHERMKDLLPLQKSKLEASLNRLFEERYENRDSDWEDINEVKRSIWNEAKYILIAIAVMGNQMIL